MKNLIFIVLLMLTLSSFAQNKKLHFEIEDSCCYGAVLNSNYFIDDILFLTEFKKKITATIPTNFEIELFEDKNRAFLENKYGKDNLFIQNLCNYTRQYVCFYDSDSIKYILTVFNYYENKNDLNDIRSIITQNLMIGYDGGLTNFWVIYNVSQGEVVTLKSNTLK